jgi:enterochelin esterase-like enzyme
MLDANITGGPLLFFAIIIAAVLVLLLVVGVFGRTRNRLWWYRVVGCALGGITLGLALSWLVSDVWDTFGAPLSPATRGWICVAFAGLALAVNALWRTRWWTRVVAALSVPMILLAAALGINADVGEFPTLGSVLTPAATPPLRLPEHDPPAPTPSPMALWQSWHPPAGMPQQGSLGSVTIPATVSKFPARQAIVYLPPAALVATAPALPVMIVLSGQPGQPMNDFQSGHLLPALEAFQKAHHGLAPIVVSPDQLGSPYANPMCVDSALGNSATYLTVDVPAWIRSHLHVLNDRAAWSIGGFSQGGTCSIQLGAAHPDLFGSILDVSGELVPRNGSPQHTVQVGFGGNPAAYEAAKPLNLLAAHAPYRNTTAIFAVGATDSRYLPWQRQMAQAAQAAGMTTQLLIAPGTGHDWHTASYALAAGLKILCSRFGLSQ